MTQFSPVRKEFQSPRGSFLSLAARPRGARLLPSLCSGHSAPLSPPGFMELSSTCPHLPLLCRKGRSFIVFFLVGLCSFVHESYFHELGLISRWMPRLLLSRVLQEGEAADAALHCGQLLGSSSVSAQPTRCLNTQRQTDPATLTWACPAVPKQPCVLCTRGVPWLRQGSESGAVPRAVKPSVNRACSACGSLPPRPGEWRPLCRGPQLETQARLNECLWDVMV